MIPVTVDLEHNNFEVMSVIECQGTNLMSVVIKVNETIGNAQFLSNKFVKKNETIDLFAGKEREIFDQIVDKINTKVGDDIILNTGIRWEDIINIKSIADECKVKLLWNVTVTHTILSWDKTSSTTPGKKTFTLKVNLLDVISD